MNYITEVIEIAGLKKVADAVGLSHQAVRKWEDRQALPRTDYTGETNYASKLAELSGGKVTVEQLRSMRGSTSKKNEEQKAA
jgi:hypothetical protein